MAWSDYYDMLNAIEKYYGSTSDVYGEVLKHGPLAENFPEIAKQAGIDVVTNAKGDVLSFSVKQNVTQDLSQGWDIANAANSNIQTGTSKNVFKIQKVSGTKVVEEGGKQIVKETPIAKFTNGVKGVLNTPVRGTVAPAIAAVAAGVQLGKAIDSSIYKIGDAMDLNPPEELNPDTWSSLVSEIPGSGLSGVYKWGFNTIFGIDQDTKNGQMYLDENALAYMAQWLNNEGVLSQGTTTIEPDDFLKKAYPGYTYDIHTGAGTTYYSDGRPPRTAVLHSSSADVKFMFLHDGFNSCQLIGASTGPFDATNSNLPDYHFESTKYILNGKTYYVNSTGPGYGTENASFDPAISYIYNNEGREDVSPTLLGYIALFGIHTTTDVKPGVSDLLGSSGINASNVTAVTDMLALLKSTYPELWENRVEQEVAQPDGTTKTFTYVPISIPTGGAGLNPDSTGNTQNGTEITEGTATDTQLNTIIQYITRFDSLNKGMQDANTSVTTPPLNPPATGDGVTPVTPTITGKASALYSIYNPTLEQVNSLGAWLWSSNFIDQLLKLFSSPMDAIIGLHKIYATPVTGGTQNIKVGYLDSGVPSKIVTEQYTMIDCGTINCYEYFGNVLDYNPYTNIRLYLPFIGIIELSNSDVMRSNINVVYHVDVLSGACLAEVKIIRDGGGGTLYQYAGNASVTMPISSGSYIGVISNVVGVAARTVSGFAVGGVAGATAGGISGALSSHGGAQVQHSGGFSGNAGAMGIKKPYLIIERPQTEIAEKAETLQGYGSNKYVALSECTGYTRVKAVHVDKIEKATSAEKDMIEEALKSGVIIR